ncbi:SCAN domain-containing protein 3-like [Mobula birostris]|uniref:SCAN domain-containing protein 3-like n=1 Tax=Mobula birostris TaxID=1983395 RepID=UPI003B285462
MACAKKHKVDQENHQLKSDWTDQFCFILPDHANAKPTCLICTQSVAVCKSENLKRHFNTVHAASFNANYPAKSDQRKQKFANMITLYKHSFSTICKSTSAQESTTAASLHVSWNLAKAKKPFADAELIKICAVDMVGEVLSHDEKTEKTVVELLKMVSLSANTATRRIEVLAEERFSNLLTNLEKAEAISLAIDSFCDRTHMEELSARFFDGKNFREKLLYLLPLPGHTTGGIIFNELTQFFEKNSLNVRKIVSIVTDGALSMVGQHKGLVSRFATVNPALLAFHCIIHQSVLCAKLCGEMKEAMDTVMRLVNFIPESSSLQHRLFRALLEEMSAEYKDLLLHIDVRWLSKGRVLERVCDLRDELVSFLSSLQSQKAQGFKRFLSDNKVMARVLFLCDIMSHLNQLNLQLQGNNHTVADMYEAIEAFWSKLNLLERDIRGRKLHFPRLREHCEKNEMQEDPVVKDFVTSLAENFREQLESSPKLSGDILFFLRQPFSILADSQWTAEAKRPVSSIDEATLQMEVLEMGTSDLLKAQHKVSDFWINLVPQAEFKNTRAVAMLLLALFPSTYICESSFSSMNFIKNQDRNRLSNAHLCQCLRIVTTEYRPDIRRIASSCRCHFSH